MNDGEKYSPRNDQDLREILRIFVSKNNFKFTVFIETPSNQNHSTNGPSRKCVNSMGLAMTRVQVSMCNTRTEKYEEALRKLLDELETRVATTPIGVSILRGTKSIYSYTYLASATFPFKDQIKIVPEKLIKVKNGES
jgi:hypothetical protein